MAFRVDNTEFRKALAKLASLNGKTQSETLLGFAKTTLRNAQGTGIIDMTPPASPGVTNGAAKAQGEKAIQRDLEAVFFGVSKKVYGPRSTEKPHAIHKRLFEYKRPGKPMRSDLPRGQSYFVDLAELKKLGTLLKKQVGRMAATWLPAADRLGVNVPAWVRRHGAQGGAIRIRLTAPKYEVEMESHPRSGSPVAELERRVRIALGYTQERLFRAVGGTQLAKDAKAAGFKTLN